MFLRLNWDLLLANRNWCVQNLYIDVENSLYQILVIPSYLVYALLKVGNFTELKRWGKNQKSRLRLDERLMCFVTYLLWPSMRTHLLYEMTLRNLGYIHTIKNSYIYLLIENTFNCNFQVWTPFYPVTQCSQKTPISWNQKKININISYHNTHLSKSDLTTQIWF